MGGFVDYNSHVTLAPPEQGYRIRTEVYSGPLDLLLDLIERAELDITRLALAQVTDQYLAYLENLIDHDAEEVSAFLVMAARLLQIKSAALLPRPTAIDRPGDEEDSAEALARQLIQYRRFKQIAQGLAGREEAGLRTYLRVAPPVVKVEARLDLSGMGLTDLVQAAREVFARPVLADLSQVVSMPRVTIREKIRSILDFLRAHPSGSFRAMLQNRNRIEVVVTFLALLELIKRHLVMANQGDLFGDIEFQSTGDLEDGGLDDVEYAE